MVKVADIADMGAYVHLLEYNNIEGMVLLSELSRRRIRSINKLIRKGRDECVVVIRVDKDKGYIDLSKRRVGQEDIVKCTEKFSNAKHVNSILRHVAELLGYETNEQLEQLYEKTAWHFDKKYGKTGASFEAFKHAVMEPEILDECEIDDETKKVLLDDIKRRLTPQAVKIRTDIDVACYHYEGIDAVKAALKSGLAVSSEEMPVKINLIAPPTYVMTTSTLEREGGIEKLQEANNLIKTAIEASKGTFTVKMEPRVVSDLDDMELKRQLAELEEANKEVDGDDDAEDDESGDDESGDEGGDGEEN